MSVETSTVTRRLSFGCFYSKEEEMRLDSRFMARLTGMVPNDFYGVVGLGAGGMLNFESSTGTFSFNSVNVRVEVGFPTSSAAARAVNGNFSPSASR